MNALQRIILVLFITLSFFSLAGCQSEDAKRKEKEVLMSQVSVTFFAGSIMYILTVFFGPSITERTRKRISDKFKLSKQDQITIAQWLYWIGTLMTLILAYNFMPYFKKVFPIMIILFGATLFPFFVNVIGGIKKEDPLEVKKGLVQIKSFFFVIIVLYVITVFINGGITIKP